MSDSLKIPTEQLQISIEIDDLDINPKTQSENPDLLGQARAIQALEFGIAMTRPGYNIFVMGETGTGKLSQVRQQLLISQENNNTINPVAYVNNFAAPKEPLAITLPKSQEQSVLIDIEALVDAILTIVPAAFESPSYQQQKNNLEQHFDNLYEQALAEVEKAAAPHQITLHRSSDGLTFSPIHQGEILDSDAFINLAPQEKERFHQQVQLLQEQLSNQLLHLPQWRRETAEKMLQLNVDTLVKVTTPLFENLLLKYSQHKQLITYIKNVRHDLTQFGLKDLFLQDTGFDLSEIKNKRDRLIKRYMPNIVIHSHNETHKPVIYEAHPSLQSLFGCIEYRQDQGVLSCCYQDILPGSLHQANGGYLILDADKLLDQPIVWEALKRAVKFQAITIEQDKEKQEASLAYLKPASIPLNIKVLLIGSRDIYYLLQELDEEFNEMFRVLADFDDYIHSHPKQLRGFAELLVQHNYTLSGTSMTRPAIKALIRHSMRLADHQHRLSAKVNETLEIITEAEFYRQRNHDNQLHDTHILAAISARNQRSGRISQALLDDMLDGTILIECTGTAVGKINGLTVLDAGDNCYGAPSRITATVHPGSKGVVDIEREADLGQSIHSKGVLILTGFLGHRYARHFPFSFSANIAIEQSYGYIDGDSASLAELCVLISALTDTPIKQNLALTGSINQYGEVQAIGGVNEKIEGFYSLCQARQLTGDQGVIIPAANRQNLVLNDAVLDAIEQQRFSIYAVEHLDQALSLLTGLEIGVLNEQNQYPEGSLNHTIIKSLKQISDISAEKEDHEHSESEKDEQASENESEKSHGAAVD